MVWPKCSPKNTFIQWKRYCVNLHFTSYWGLFSGKRIRIVPLSHVNSDYAVNFCWKNPFSMSYRSLLWVDSPWLTKMQPQDDLYSIEKTLCKYIFYFIYPGLFCSSEALLYQPPLQPRVYISKPITLMPNHDFFFSCLTN